MTSARIYRNQRLRYVVGAPGTGKSTYIRQHRHPADMVLDLDALAVALGSVTPDHHKYPHLPQHKALAHTLWRPLAERLKRIAATSRFSVWIIHSDPPPPVLQRYKKNGVVIDMSDV